MKFVVVSDTHGKHRQLVLPEGDCIIHCGDISSRGYKQEVYDFLDWFEKLPFTYKIFVAGNHDFFFEEADQEEVDNALKDRGIIYLENDYIEIEGIKIYGSPVTPFFFAWAFNVHRGEEIKKYWDKIPQNLDMLITHGPPRGILDASVNGEFCGCKDLFNAVMDKKPKYHLFGHIHEGYGKEFCLKDQRGELITTFINASVLDEDYKLVNAPIVFEIDY